MIPRVKHRISIRTKFVGFSALIVLALFAVLILYFFQRQEKLYEEALLAELENQSTMAAYGLGTGLGVEDFRVIRQGIREVKENRNFLYLAVVDTLGATVALDNPKNIPIDVRTLRALPQIHAESSVVRIWQPVLYGRLPLGILFIGFSNEIMENKIAEMRRTSYIIASGTIVVLFALMWFISSSITNPLIHMTRAVESIANGNMLQRVESTSNDEVGTLAGAFNQMSERLEETHREKDKLIHDLEEAIANVKVLSGLLPICASCKKIRDGQGGWNVLEQYIEEHSDAGFTHGLCPECTGKYFPMLKK